ncbi:MAG: molybdenum cofactor guanylyltransferase [Bacteroidetes bacterium]|nr:molybdenum cofactor guanylyltransferase [Bacteroidota bacterium]
MSNELTALILAGGKSQRMGKDKALINYTGKPHIFYLADLLSPFCSKILISRNKEQAPFPKGNFEIIYDDESSENQGPLTGLISAIKQFPNENFITIYCDLINIDETLLKILIDGRDANKFATCFIKEDFPEPSMVIFESKSNHILLEKYNSGRYSIIKFLKEHDCKYIPLQNELIDKDE